jgi:hypothetical protein
MRSDCGARYTEEAKLAADSRRVPLVHTNDLFHSASNCATLPRRATVFGRELKRWYKRRNRENTYVSPLQIISLPF